MIILAFSYQKYRSIIQVEVGGKEISGESVDLCGPVQFDHAGNGILGTPSTSDDDYSPSVSEYQPSNDGSEDEEEGNLLNQPKDPRAMKRKQESNRLSVKRRCVERRKPARAFWRQQDELELIELVSQHEALYNRESPEYGNKRLKRQIWENIGMVLKEKCPGINEKQLQYRPLSLKWNKLRVKWADEYSRITASRKKMAYQETSFINRDGAYLGSAISW